MLLVTVREFYKLLLLSKCYLFSPEATHLKMHRTRFMPWQPKPQPFILKPEQQASYLEFDGGTLGRRLLQSRFPVAFVAEHGIVRLVHSDIRCLKRIKGWDSGKYDTRMQPKLPRITDDRSGMQKLTTIGVGEAFCWSFFDCFDEIFWYNARPVRPAQKESDSSYLELWVCFGITSVGILIRVDSFKLSTVLELRCWRWKLEWRIIIAVIQIQWTTFGILVGTYLYYI